MEVGRPSILGPSPTNNFFGEDDMQEIMPQLLEKAKLRARELKDIGEVIGSVPFGEAPKDTYVVSSDPSLVIYYAHFNVGGTIFYFGDRK